MGHEELQARHSLSHARQVYAWLEAGGTDPCSAVHAAEAAAVEGKPPLSTATCGTNVCHVGAAQILLPFGRLWPSSQRASCLDAVV